MALHEQSVGATDEWYTPPHVFEAMGTTFDLDVASPGAGVVPWIPAPYCITKEGDALRCRWYGLVWMNPPFGGRNGIVPWLDRFFAHPQGVALVPDRTSAPWWQHYVPQSDAVLFVAPKLKFIRPDGTPGKSPAQGTCLLARGRRAVDTLRRAHHAGLGVMFPRHN